MKGVSPPDSVKQMMKDFSEQLRVKKTTQKTSQAVALYRRILRENVKSVALAVYPLFLSKRKEEEIDDLIDTFFEKYSASAPEFHKIATELLLFFREKDNIAQRDKLLIEYEWLLYTIEIDTHHIEKTADFPNFDASNSVRITVNPTLQLVELPFDFDKEDFLAEENQNERYYYAIYRKQNNALFQKKVPLEDVQFIVTIKNHDGGMILEKGNHLIEQNGFQPWLKRNFHDEILFLEIIQ